ncbi:MAG TPA: carboxypeptidase regulatory-like domain-containing protein [Candidatus Acidoferrales bacterium]|jgi:tetratricopeptide (TPR) repeat protein|nr:carboxypeptidase regulatory-like domain-containing protein [Candidatus Acidoferrales bacterium]
MFLRRLPLFLSTLALSVLPAIAQNTPNRHSIYSIAGSVRDESNHRSMESIQVALKQATGTPVTTAFTRENGDFQFDGLPNGDYIVEINLKDYDQFQEQITISGASRVGLSIFLTKSAKAVNQGLNQGLQLSISAHQLSVPHKAHDEFEKGMSLIYLKSDYRGALAQFQLAIKDFPTYYEAYAEEGNAYYGLEDLGHAEEALQKSIDLSSGQYADAMFTLASVLSDTKRYKEAETLSRRGVSVDASSWRGPFELARALTALKQTDEAEKSAQKSRDLMPDNPPVYLLLANIHIQRKDYPALMRDLDGYLRLAPLGPEADQARKTREHVQSLLNAPKDESDEDADDQDEPEKDGGHAHPNSQKATSPAEEPDTSGLPSLPPPSPGNR